jgi:hypothetical protein
MLPGKPGLRYFTERYIYTDSTHRNAAIRNACMQKCRLRPLPIVVRLFAWGPGVGGGGGWEQGFHRGSQIKGLREGQERRAKVGQWEW